MQTKGAIPKLKVTSVRELAREDLDVLSEEKRNPETGSPQRLRDSHHNIARFVASGLRDADICQRTGYSPQRLYTMKQSPAFQELVALYREKVDEAFIEAQDEYFTLATNNMLAAERHIADHIGELDDEGKLLPIKTALAISRDAADRFGYGKKQTNVNVNVDFAAQLEKAIKRSGKTIEQVPQTTSGRTLNAPQVVEERGRAVGTLRASIGAVTGGVGVDSHSRSNPVVEPPRLRHPIDTVASPPPYRGAAPASSPPLVEQPQLLRRRA